MQRLILIIAILISCTSLKLAAQTPFSYYKIGLGADISYRVPYANNNWMPGLALDVRMQVSGRIKQWEPELYFRKGLFNFTDRVEYHDGKTIELGLNSIYHIKDSKHAFLGGLGLNQVSHIYYDYSPQSGWKERAKRAKAKRLVFQIAYQFYFSSKGRFSPAVRLGYHSIRKFQLGIDLNYKILPS